MARINISDGATQRSVELSDAVSICGRAPENKIAIEDKQASRKHCQIEKTELGYKVIDLESRNGTRVNDRQVNQALLRPGDKIQIGKHVLTFEDPAWKEPSADVVARLAASEPPPSALPKAVEVSKPAPAPSEGEARNTRRKSGHTTSINKIARTEMRKEQQTLTLVAVGAGIFIFILIALVAFSGGGTEPKGQKQAQDLLTQARQFASAQRYDQAIATLAKIGPEQKALYGQAQNLMRQIELQQTAKSGPTSEAERKEFDELYDFAEKNRTNPGTFERMATMCEDFRKKYPKSGFASKIDEYHRLAVDGRKAARRGDLTESEKQTQEDLKRQDFASALKRVKGMLARYNDEPEVRERLVKLQDDVTDKAKTFFQVKKAEAEDLKQRTRKDEARAVYQALIGSLGTGSVPEFEDYCKIAKNLLEAIQ